MPTSFGLVESEIRQRLAAGVGDIPVLYENMPKTQIRDGNGEMPSEFVHLTIYNIDHRIRTIGSAEHMVRYGGVFDVNIFTPIAQGSGRASEIADTVAGVFNNALFNRINTRIQRVQDIGEKGQYWQSFIAFVFEADYYE